MTGVRLARIGLLAVVGFGLVTAWQLGFFDLLASAERTADALRGLGGWGYALYVLSFSLFGAFFVPGIAFVVPAAIVWPAPVAFGLSVVGAAGAASVGFGFARFLARDWAAARVPAAIRRRAEALEVRPIRTVIVIRLLFSLFPPSHWALGVSQVPFGSYVVGSLIGYVPLMALLTWVGGGLMEWLLGQPPVVWQGAAIVVGALIVLRWLNARRQASTVEP